MHVCDASGQTCDRTNGSHPRLPYDPKWGWGKTIEPTFEHETQLKCFPKVRAWPQLGYKSTLPSWAQKSDVPTNIHVFASFATDCSRAAFQVNKNALHSVHWAFLRTMSCCPFAKSISCLDLLQYSVPIGPNARLQDSQRLSSNRFPISGCNRAAWTYPSPHLVQSTKQGVVPMLKDSQLSQPSVVGEVNINIINSLEFGSIKIGSTVLVCFDSWGGWNQLLPNSFVNFWTQVNRTQRMISAAIRLATRG